MKKFVMAVAIGAAALAASAVAFAGEAFRSAQGEYVWNLAASHYESPPYATTQTMSIPFDDGKTIKRWSETTVRRVSAYLTGCCADYGMLERGLRSSRRILPFRVSPLVAAYLAYELHLSGVGDNALLAHDDWQLFGLAREDVLEEIKRLSLKGLLIVQAAGDVIRISWKQQDMEALCDVLTQS